MDEADRVGPNGEQLPKESELEPDRTGDGAHPYGERDRERDEKVLARLARGPVGKRPRMRRIFGPLGTFVDNVISIMGGYGSADTLAAAGSAVAPASGAAIASIAAPPAGTYEVRTRAGYGSTADVIDGMELRKGATKISNLYVAAAANLIPAEGTFPRVTVDGTQAISINASQAGAAGSVYNAKVVATKLAL